MKEVCLTNLATAVDPVDSFDESALIRGALKLFQIYGCADENSMVKISLLRRWDSAILKWFQFFICHRGKVFPSTRTVPGISFDVFIEVQL